MAKRKEKLTKRMKMEMSKEGQCSKCLKDKALVKKKFGYICVHCGHKINLRR